jgi:hypothetical protein
MDALRSMTPEQRERVLEKFPPTQQAKMREQLAKFDSLPEAQKQRQLQFYDEFWKLAPDKQSMVRTQIKAFEQLPDDRKLAVKNAYARLSRETPEGRADILNRPNFRNRFSPEELQILTVLPQYYPIPPR